MTDNPQDDYNPIEDGFAAGTQFYRRPGARLTQPQAESVKRLSETPRGLHAGYHAFDLAHAVMLTEQNILPESVSKQLLTGLQELEDESGDATLARTEVGRGAHSGEAYLIQKYGEEIGGWLHIGRSSHDLKETAERIVLRDRILTVGNKLASLLEAYTDRAAETIDAVLPTYTGLQHAQVATIGYKLCAFAFAHVRDFERLLALYDRINRSTAGAAVGTTSDVDLDRERLASLLGFDAVRQNAEDVDKSVDEMLEASGVLATIATNIGQAADQFLLWYATEVNIIDLPDELCGTSSIMPQKKNPHSIEVVQRDTNELITEAFQQYIAAKNLAGGVGIDPAVVEHLGETIDTWQAVIEGVHFNKERAEALVYTDWALATDLASLLVRDAELPWRSAHQIVAILVREFENNGQTIQDVAAEDLARVAAGYNGSQIDVNEDSLESVLDPQAALQRRADVIGSPAPTQVQDQIATLQGAVSEYRDALTEYRDSLQRSRQRRETAIDAILKPDKS